MISLKNLFSFRLKKIFFLLPLVCPLCTTNCTAQVKKNKDYVIAKKKLDSLKTYSTKYKITIESLRQFNPKIDHDSVKKGDTIFLVAKSVLPKQPEVQEFSEQAIGKGGMFKTLMFNGKKYFECEVDPHQYKIELYNQINNEKGVYDFISLANAKKKELLFAMNGGMYEEDLSPVGLFVTEGKIYKDINIRKDGKGNFYELTPNGIFMLDSTDTPFIITSENYSPNKYKIKIATQSGPMLVINGVFNTHFTKGSENVKIRNGVGVNKKGKVIFIISADPVNFYEMSQLFRDKLGCNNALYLDGVISQYYVPELQGSPRQGAKLGVFITVSRRIGKTQPRDK